MDEPTYATSSTDDSWSVLALPDGAVMRHVRVLEALRTFRPHPETGIRSVEQDRLAAAAGLHLDTLRQARAELIAWGVIAYRAGRGRGNNSEYWIRPAAPGKADAPKPLKRGSHRPPFLVPLKRGVGVPKKGGDPPLKRGVAKSSDQRKREDKRTTSREQHQESLSGDSLLDQLKAADPSLTREKYGDLLDHLEQDPKVDKPRPYCRGVLAREDAAGVRAFITAYTDEWTDLRNQW